MIINPVLQLNKTQPLPPKDLFQKICPSDKGLVVADLAHDILEIHASGYGKSMDCITRPGHLSREIVDPKHKLQNIFNEQKIKCIKGNVPVDEAEIVLLDDVLHGDKDQDNIRGQVTNALRNKANIFLVEGIDNQTIIGSAQAKKYLPSNIDFDPSQDLCAGWDDGLVHQNSINKIRLNLQELKFAEQNQDENLLLKEIEDISSVTNEYAYERTKSEWKSIVKYKTTFPNLKIFVFAGAAHNREQSLQDNLKNSGYKYCVITPKKCQKLKKEDAIEHAMQYYQVNPNLTNFWTHN